MSSGAPDQVGSFHLIRALASISLIAGILVVFVFQLTQPRIEDNRRRAIERAVLQVVPGSVSRRDFVLDEQGLHAIAEKDGKSTVKLYSAYDKDGRFSGIALEASAQGYQAIIRLLYGYQPSCQCITGIKVIQATETPGLGDLIAKDPDFLANFEALDASLKPDHSALINAIVTVKHGRKREPWQIDAISGATVSSMAVGKALNQSASEYLPRLWRHLQQLEQTTFDRHEQPVTSTESNRLESDS